MHTHTEEYTQTYGRQHTYTQTHLCERTVHDDVYPQDLHRVEGIWPPYDIVESYETQCCHRGAQLESEEIFDIVEDALALFHGVHYRREVVVKDYHSRSLFGHISSWREGEGDK
jgi:hypothetical protein